VPTKPKQSDHVTVSTINDPTTPQKETLTDDTVEPGDLLVAALYRFVDLGRGRDAHEALREPILAFMRKNKVKGTLLLAQEGINGTIAGPMLGVQKLIKYLRYDPLFEGLLTELEPKYSRVGEQPFNRTKVRLKREIVTMGVEGIDPNHVVGTYVEPKDWNDLIDQDDVLLVDTRNRYEYDVGTFHTKGNRAAVDPKTDTFREFPSFVDAEMDPVKHKKVAMFCTGGIRCEKATAYLKQKGFDEVYHLKGGILKYLEEVPAEKSRWQGECFVFDDRVAVGNDLKPGSFVLCYACRLPVHVSQLSDPRYQVGVSCPHCYDQLIPERKAQFAERQKQIELAKARCEQHIGDETR